MVTRELVQLWVVDLLYEADEAEEGVAVGARAHGDHDLLEREVFDGPALFFDFDHLAYHELVILFALFLLFTDG